jgi:uncharacterized coiled-coil protein SlyX
MNAERYAELDKELRDRLAALEAEVAEKTAYIAELRATIAQMERDTPTLTALARMIQSQKDQQAATIAKLQRNHSEELAKARDNGSGR